MKIPIYVVCEGVAAAVTSNREEAFRACRHYKETLGNVFCVNETEAEIEPNIWRVKWTNTDWPFDKQRDFPTKEEAAAFISELQCSAPWHNNRVTGFYAVFEREELITEKL